MVRTENIHYCDGCGVEIQLSPVLKDDRQYCCQDCSQGLACHCAERMELDERRRADEDTGNLPGIELGP